MILDVNNARERFWVIITNGNILMFVVGVKLKTGGEILNKGDNLCGIEQVGLFDFLTPILIIGSVILNLYFIIKYWF